MGGNQEDRDAFLAHTEEGFLQAERGELIDDERARREIQAIKENWRDGRSRHVGIPA
jgi:hypothetical protein